MKTTLTIAAETYMSVGLHTGRTIHLNVVIEEDEPLSHTLPQALETINAEFRRLEKEYQAVEYPSE